MISKRILMSNKQLFHITKRFKALKNPINLKSSCFDKFRPRFADKYKISNLALITMGFSVATFCVLGILSVVAKSQVASLPKAVAEDVINSSKDKTDKKKMYEKSVDLLEESAEMGELKYSYLVVNGKIIKNEIIKKQNFKTEKNNL
ncbi:hypothetical protein MHBO_003281, partial [Bonamia ostreae]